MLLSLAKEVQDTNEVQTSPLISVPNVQIAQDDEFWLSFVSSQHSFWKNRFKTSTMLLVFRVQNPALPTSRETLK